MRIYNEELYVESYEMKQRSLINTREFNLKSMQIIDFDCFLIAFYAIDFIIYYISTKARWPDDFHGIEANL